MVKLMESDGVLMIENSEGNVWIITKVLVILILNNNAFASVYVSNDASLDSLLSLVFFA